MPSLQVVTVLSLIVLLAGAAPVVVVILILRALERSLERVLSHQASHQLVGGQPIDILNQQAKLASDRLDFERQKHRMVLERLGPANLPRDPETE